MFLEEWRAVADYEGIYEVNSKGEVRSAKGKTTESVLHGTRVWKQRILKQKTDKNGYKRVSLWKRKTSKDFLVHRLVAVAFINKVDGKECINHIDGNPSNNQAENLEWCNHRENLIHAFENRLNKSPDPIVLRNMNTNELHYFYSKSEASKFLGRNNGFVSGVVKKGRCEIDEFEVFSKPVNQGVIK